MNRDGHPANLVPAHPGNRNARTHGIFDMAAREVRAAEFAAKLLGEFNGVDAILEALVWQAASETAFIEQIDRWLAGLGGPPPPRERYLNDWRSAALNRRMKLFPMIAERQAALVDRKPVLEFELVDYVAELQRLARSPSTSDQVKLRALNTLIDLGVNGTAAGALAEDARRREASMTRATYGRRHVKDSDGIWREEQRASE